MIQTEVKLEVEDTRTSMSQPQLEGQANRSDEAIPPLILPVFLHKQTTL